MGMAFKTSMPPVRKFVLVAMCDMANDAEQGLTYPSIATIARHCSVDRRTVERAIKELEVEGYVATDRRPGMKSRYRINLDMLNQARVDYMTERSENLRQKVAGDTESQATESRSTYGTESHLPTTESRNTYGTESHITRSNQKEPESNQKRESAKRAAPISCPADVDQQVWGDWLALRKDKKAAVTASVLQSAEKEAVKAGMTLEAFLREWCFRGSQGLKAEWLKDKAIQVRRPAADDFGSRSYGPGGLL
jgi:DNA-binding transcriptional regulator YhcF (GntR family)